MSRSQQVTASPRELVSISGAETLLTILGNPRRACDRLTRRELLQVAGAGMLGTSLPRVWGAEEIESPLAARARSVLFLFL